MLANMIKLYFKVLEDGDYNQLMSLFTDDAIVNSLIYGERKASEFYRELFKDTISSTITLLHIFENGNTGIGHFRYDWILKDGTPVFFECVDIFEFSEGKIKHLKIIYDTHKVRAASYQFQHPQAGKKDADHQ